MLQYWKIVLKPNLKRVSSGKSIEKSFNLIFKKKLTAKEIFNKYRDKDSDAANFINSYKKNLARG